MGGPEDLPGPLLGRTGHVLSSPFGHRQAGTPTVGKTFASLTIQTWSGGVKAAPPSL